MPICVIAQPIHPIGAQILREAGVEVRQSPGPGLDSLREVIAEPMRSSSATACPPRSWTRTPRLRVIANHGTALSQDRRRPCGVERHTRRFHPDANVRSVAERADADACHRPPGGAGRCRDAQGPLAFQVRNSPRSLRGKTLGIVGWGRTGRLALRHGRAGAGHARVVVWSPSPPADGLPSSGATRVDTLHELLRTSDVVSLHRPLRGDTRHTLTRRRWTR